MSDVQAFELETFLKTERAAIEAARARVVDEVLADMSATIADPVRYALDAGGKRLRPVLCVAAYRAVRGMSQERGKVARPAEATSVHGSSGGGTDSDGAMPPGIYTIACGLELIHTYSLIHDDLPCMDDDDLRRGKPTTHRVYGERRAIVAGATLIALACRAVADGGLALGLAEAERMAMVGELCRAAGGGGMVGGQLLDLEAEGRPITLEELESIHRRKTGALLVAALRLGGLAARADRAVVDALGEFGAAIGLAFQIADDVLDVTASTAELGKTAGRDAELAKATYPALLGLDGARARAREEADRGIVALRAAGVESPALEALARYAVERDR